MEILDRTMNRVPLLLTTLIAFLIFGGADRARAADAPATAIRVVVLGSSTAEGYGPTYPENAWVNRYRTYLQSIDPTAEVINLAVGGFTTYEVMPSWYTPPSWRSDHQPRPNSNITKALSLHPTLIIVNLPSNDQALVFPLSETMSNYGTIAAEADAAGVPIYISTTQPRNSSQQVRDLLAEVRDSTFARYGSHAVDFWTDVANANGTIRAIYDVDGVHLNDEGHGVLFDRVMTSVPISPILTASPSPVDFGQVLATGSSSRTVTITNHSATAMTVTNLSPGTSKFSVNPTSLTVSGNGSQNIQVTFTPGGVGTFTDELQGTYNEGVSTLRIPLTGSSPVPVLSASPTSMDFGDVANGSSRTLPVVLSNSSANALVITGVSTRSSEYAPDRTSLTIPPSSVDTLRVTFIPNGFGFFVDSLTLLGNAQNMPYRIALSGRSPTPVFDVSPAFLEFGDVPLNQSKTIPVQVTNRSLNTVMMDPIVTTNEHYTLDKVSGSVEPQQTFTVQVTFTPTGYATVLDTLEIVNNTLQSPTKIFMRGKSPVPVLAPATADVNFSLVNVGDSTVSTLTLRNLSPNPLTVSQLLTGTANFSGRSVLPQVIGGMDSGTVIVVFAPTTGGQLRDSLQVVSDGGTAIVLLSGQAPQQRLVSTPGNVDFGRILHGTTTTRVVAITPVVSDQVPSVRVDSLVLRGPLFSIVQATQDSLLSNGDTLKVTLRFAPPAVSVYFDTLLVYSDIPFSPTRIPLRGEGALTASHEPVPAGTPTEYRLAQNYPNPFNPATTLEFALPVVSIVSLRVYDVMGQEVALVMEGRLDAGYHRYSWNAEGNAGGVYFLRFTAAPASERSAVPFTETKKLLLLK